MSKIKRCLFVVIGTAGLGMGTLGVHAQSTAPRIQQTDIVHLGSFTVPTAQSGGKANAAFEYGGTALGFNPVRNSLFMTGHPWDQFTGEISIPALGGTASLLQSLTDSTEGKLGQINPGDPNSKLIGGNLPWGDKLIVSAYAYYDGSGTQVLSHFIRPIDLATKGQAIGPVRVGALGAGLYSGYMGVIPPEWQVRLGGPALTGNADIGIISRSSYGPAAFAFNPSQITSTGAVPLVYYPDAHQTLGSWGVANPYFGASDSIRGIAFPGGTSTVLFVGRHGTTFCYGPGTSDPALGGTPSGNGLNPWCYDPTTGDKGPHGYPYYPSVWAYDANDLAAVRSGAKNPWDVLPYAIWTLPGMGQLIGGAAYDPATKRLYVSEMLAAGDRPLIHVFSINAGTGGTVTAPQPPSNLRIVP